MAVTGGTRRIVGGVDTHKDLHTSQRSSTNRTGSSEHDPSPRLGKAIARCSPGCGPSENYNVSKSSSTGSYGAGLLRFMQQAKVAVLEVTPPTSRIDVDAARTTISTPRTPPMPPLQVSR